MKNLQVLDKPLVLKAGVSAILKINGHFQSVTVVSDNGKTVEFSYPLRPNDGNVYHAFKEHVYLPLKALKDEFSLCLKKNTGSELIPQF